MNPHIDIKITVYLWFSQPLFVLMEITV